MNNDEIVKSISQEIERAIKAQFNKSGNINLEKIIHEGGVCLATNHIILQDKLPQGLISPTYLDSMKEGIFLKLHELFPNNFTNEHHWMIEKVYSNIIKSPNPKGYIDNHYNKLFENKHDFLP